jgi:hypothetical protein
MRGICVLMVTFSMKKICKFIYNGLPVPIELLACKVHGLPVTQRDASFYSSYLLYVQVKLASLT